MKRRFFVIVPAILLILAITASFAWARLGGGGDFGGGHGGGGGGGSGGDDAIIYIVFQILRLLLWLCIEYPAVGIPLTIALVIAVGYFSVRRMNGKTVHEVEYSPPSLPRSVASLDSLRGEDPNFSEILFLDFVQMIYTRYQQARGSDGDPATLIPYLSPTEMTTLQTRRRPDTQVHDVIIGAMNVGNIKTYNNQWIITVNLETNYTLTPAGQKKGKAYYTQARLTFSRNAGVLSKGPEFTKTLGCPSCGSPVKIDASGACAYCGTIVKPGEFAWQLTSLTELTVKERYLAALSLGGVEAGTNLPTVYAPDLNAARKAFALAYPEFKWDVFRERIDKTFYTLQTAWSENKPEQLRPYETDRLFQTHLFWLQRYEDHGYANKLESINLERIDVVKVERDPYFDIITVRLFAAMVDYTVDKTGKVISGNKNKTRKFSEYWTFIRKAGFKKVEPKSEWDEPGDHCPSCGAPLKVSMHGVCEYCGANITSGDFDWTLAKIEQDDVYRG